jgi:hypothetical protein
MSAFSWDGHARLDAYLAGLEDPDASALMEEWEAIIVEDNARGVMAGRDKDDAPMPPVTYRDGRAGRPRKGDAFGAHNPGVAGNLAPADYRRLTGPPLAPRGLDSRVITNLMTEHGRDPAEAHAWYAKGAWLDVVNADGVPFLQYHFDGAGKLPRRDLRGVRPEGLRRAEEALARWVDNLLKG